VKDRVVDSACLNEMFYFRMYQEAISYYEKALALSTRSVSTYAGLAYTYHLQVYKNVIIYPILLCFSV